MHNVFQKVWTRGEMDLLPLWRRMQEVAELEQTMATGFDEAGEAVKPAKVLEAVKGGLKGMAERRATAVGNRDDAAVAQLDQMRERLLLIYVTSQSDVAGLSKANLINDAERELLMALALLGVDVDGSSAATKAKGKGKGTSFFSMASSSKSKRSEPASSTSFLWMDCSILVRRK